MAQSMYLIISSKAQAKQVFKDHFPNCNIKTLIGELQTSHIYVQGFAKTKDNQIVVEIPASLKKWQTKILKSQYANRLKTQAEVQLLLKDEV